MNRRDFLSGMLAAAIAPAFVKTAGLLMPVKPIIAIPDQWIVPASAFEGELADIVRRAFVPKMVREIYKNTPLMNALLLGQPVSGGDRIIIPVSA